MYQFKYLGKVPLCNKKRNRAPIIFGQSFILCWRCCGIVFGWLWAILIFKLNLYTINTYTMLFTVVSVLIFCIDVSSVYVLKKEGQNSVRFITGTFFSFFIQLLVLELFKGGF